MGGWTEALLSQLNNSKRQDKHNICQWEANRNQWVGYRIGLALISVILSPKGRSKSLPVKFQSTDWRSTKMSIEHVLGYIGWLWSDAMNNCTAFVKALNEWTQIDRNKCGCQVAWSPGPMWWWPCFNIAGVDVIMRLHHIMHALMKSIYITVSCRYQVNIAPAAGGSTVELNKKLDSKNGAIYTVLLTYRRANGSAISLVWYDNDMIVRTNKYKNQHQKIKIKMINTKPTVRTIISSM